MADTETNTTPEASVATKRTRHRRTSILAVAFVALLATGVGVGAASDTKPAAAWAWDPHVALTGAISCPAWGGPYDTVKWAWVSADNGEAGWASLGSGGTRKPYRYDFWKIPSWRSVRVTVTYGCSATGKRSTSFGVSRPSTGIYTTRNIY